jgi:hypothetical protein
MPIFSMWIPRFVAREFAAGVEIDAKVGGLGADVFEKCVGGLVLVRNWIGADQQAAFCEQSRIRGVIEGAIPVLRVAHHVGDDSSDAIPVEKCGLHMIEATDVDVGVVEGGTGGECFGHGSILRSFPTVQIAVTSATSS